MPEIKLSANILSFSFVENFEKLIMFEGEMLKRFHLSGRTDILSIDSKVRILLRTTIIDPGSERANKSFRTNDI